MKLSIEQLRSRVWQTKSDAIKELKRNGFAPTGETALTYVGNQWQIADPGVPPVSPPADKKSGGGKAKKVHPADIRARELILSATSYTVHFIASPTKKFTEEAVTLDEARAMAARMNADHGKGGRRAQIYANPPDNIRPVPISREFLAEMGEPIPQFLKPLHVKPIDTSDIPEAGEDFFKKAKLVLPKVRPPKDAAASDDPAVIEALDEGVREALRQDKPSYAVEDAAVPAEPVEAAGAVDPVQAPEAPEATPPPPGTDLTPLAVADGPYSLRIRHSDLRQDYTVVDQARQISRSLKMPVEILGPTDVVRLIDHQAISARGRAPKIPTIRKAAAARKGSGTPRVAGEGKFPRAIKLWSRPQGATEKEIVAVTGWDNLTQRYVNRASRMTGGKIEHLGGRHWRLILPTPKS